jgi:hypothetical protein
VRGCGRADRVASMVEDWRDMCPGRGEHACSALLVAVWWLNLKTTQRYKWWVSPSLGLKTWRCDSGENRRWHMASSRRARRGKATSCGVEREVVRLKSYELGLCILSLVKWMSSMYLGIV